MSSVIVGAIAWSNNRRLRQPLQRFPPQTCRVCQRTGWQPDLGQPSSPNDRRDRRCLAACDSLAEGMVVIKLARGFAKKIKMLLPVSHACGGVARDAAEIDNITIFIHLLCLLVMIACGTIGSMKLSQRTGWHSDSGLNWRQYIPDDKQIIMKLMPLGPAPLSVE